MRPKPIDEEFNDSYQDKGLQPRGLGANVANDIKRQPSDRYQAANDNEYPIRERRQREGANDNYSTPARPIYTPQNNPVTQKYLRGVGQSGSVTTLGKKALRTAARSKIIATNTSIYAWAFPAWVFIQLPLALLTLGFLGLAGLAQGILEVPGIGYFAGIAVSIVDGVLSFFDSLAGTELAGLTDPNAYVIALTSLLFLLALLKLLIIGLIYELTLVNSLFGKGSSIKISALLIAIFGYFFPFLNLFPWFFLWTFAVALYPPLK